MIRTLIVIFTFSFALQAQAAPKRRHVRGTVPLPQDLGKNVSPSKSPTNAAGFRPVDKSRLGQKEPVAGEAVLKHRDEPGLPRKCEQKQSLETFIQISSATRPQAPPQGGVYFLSDLRDMSQLFYLGAPNQWPSQMTFFSGGVPYFRVSPDGEKILVATHQGGNEQYEIHLLEPKHGMRLTPLLVDPETRVESVAWGPDSKWFVFTSNARNKTDMDLYRFDLKAVKPELLSELSGSHEVTDVSPDGKKVAITNFRSISDSDVIVWDLTSKSMNRLPKRGGDSRDFAGEFSGDSQNLFYLSDAAGGIVQLNLLSLTSEKNHKPLSFGKWDVEDFSLNRDRTAIVYVTNEEGYSHFDGFELDRRGKKGRNLTFPPSPKSIVSSPTFGPRGNLFFAETSATQSSDIWEWRGERKSQWTRSSQTWMDTDCLSKEELVRYPTFDGKSIPAFLYLPRDTHGPVPFIVYLHGGPESQYRPAFSRLFQYFLQRGFGVFAPNIRGSIGYGREYNRLDNYKLRMDSVKDAVAGAKWLLSSHYTSPGKLAIYGGSYGGFMVLRSIQVEPDLFSAASESVGISNFVTFLKNTKPYRRSLREVEYGPLTDEEFLTSVSPMTYLDQIKTPLLVFHGANDPRVPVSEAEQIIAALKKREVPVEFKIFADEGHGNAKLRNIMEQARLTVHFFEKHMAGANTIAPVISPSGAATSPAQSPQ